MSPCDTRVENSILAIMLLPPFINKQQEQKKLVGQSLPIQDGHCIAATPDYSTAFTIFPPVSLPLEHCSSKKIKIIPRVAVSRKS